MNFKKKMTYSFNANASKMAILLGFVLVSVFQTAASSINTITGLETKTNPQYEFYTKWLNGAEYTLEITRLMPIEDFNFRPTAESMSFGQQLLHIAANMDWLGSTYLNAEPHSMPLRDTIYGKEDLIHILEEGFEKAAIAIKNLGDEQMEEVVDFFAGPMTKRQIVHLMHDHHTHHRGQLIVYLRLNGLEPPRYRGW